MMIRKTQKKIGEILVAKGLINDQQLQDALTQQRKSKKFLGEILIENYSINEKDLLGVLSEQFDIEVVSLKNKYIDWSFVKGFSSSLILDHKCFPVKKDAQAITIAITNPLDVWALKKSEDEARGLGVIWVLVSQKDMQEVIQQYQQYIRGNISNLFK
jgi:type IV pilus assembly protein PilB